MSLTGRRPSRLRSSLPPLEVSLEGLRVLYVDDEGVNRNVGKRMLQKLGCIAHVLTVRRRVLHRRSLVCDGSSRCCVAPSISRHAHFAGALLTACSHQ